MDSVKSNTDIQAGPAIGGFFAEPADNFPSVFSQDGLFGRFPYLLLNIVCSAILLAAVILGIFFAEETHPDFQPGATKRHEAHGPTTPILTIAGPHVDLRRESYGTFNAVSVDRRQLAEYRDSQLPKPKAFTKDIMMLIIALGIFTYHSMAYDNLIPIFFQDKPGSEGSTLSSSAAFAGGLGLSTRSVGIIMFFNGISALLIQGIIFPLIAIRFGVWKSFIAVTFGHPLAYAIVPYLVLLPPQTLYVGIYTALTLRNVFGILAYPLLLILLKEASPSPSTLGKINGLAASAGASCRMLASPVAGWLYSLGMRKEFTPLAWWVTAGVAVVGVFQMVGMKQPGRGARARIMSVAGIVGGEEFGEVVEDGEEGDEEERRGLLGAERRV